MRGKWNNQRQSNQNDVWLRSHYSLDLWAPTASWISRSRPLDKLAAYISKKPNFYSNKVFLKHFRAFVCHTNILALNYDYMIPFSKVSFPLFCCLNWLEKGFFSFICLIKLCVNPIFFCSFCLFLNILWAAQAGNIWKHRRKHLDGCIIWKMQCPWCPIPLQHIS